jgi:hypothetical protein
MALLIYLNENQAKIITSTGTSLATLTEESLKEYLSNADYINLSHITYNLLLPGGLLNNLGLAYTNYENLQNEYVDDTLVLPTFHNLTERNITLQASFSNKLILIYEEVQDTNNNSMSVQACSSRQCILKNIVEAMFKALDFKDIKFTTPFEWYFNHA